MSKEFDRPNQLRPSDLNEGDRETVGIHKRRTANVRSVIAAMLDDTSYAPNGVILKLVAIAEEREKVNTTIQKDPTSFSQFEGSDLTQEREASGEESYTAMIHKLLAERAEASSREAVLAAQSRKAEETLETLRRITKGVKHPDDESESVPSTPAARTMARAKEAKAIADSAIENAQAERKGAMSLSLGLKLKTFRGAWMAAKEYYANHPDEEDTVSDYLEEQTKLRIQAMTEPNLHRMVKDREGKQKDTTERDLRDYESLKPQKKSRKDGRTEENTFVLSREVQKDVYGEKIESINTVTTSEGVTVYRSKKDGSLLIEPPSDGKIEDLQINLDGDFNHAIVIAPAAFDSVQVKHKWKDKMKKTNTNIIFQNASIKDLTIDGASVIVEEGFLENVEMKSYKGSLVVKHGDVWSVENTGNEIIIEDGELYKGESFGEELNVVDGDTFFIALDSGAKASVGGDLLGNGKVGYESRLDVGGSILGDVDIERGRADVGVDVDGNVKLDWGGRISVGRDVGGDLTAVDSNVIIERDIEGSLTLLDRSKAVVKGRVHGVVSTDETSQFENALL